jgi:hypothetical protein
MNECLIENLPRGRADTHAVRGSACARAARPRRADGGADARRQSGASAPLLRRKATLNFVCYESGGARPVAESLCALCAEACSSDGSTRGFARGDATSGVAWRISPLLKFRWSRQTRHCSSPPLSGALRLSSGRFTDAREESRPASPATTWKCVALTKKACARSTSSTKPRAPRARRLSELLRPDSNFSRRSL